jgi:hypothetical protein
LGRFGHRQNPLINVPQEEVQSAFDAILARFPEEWLTDDKGDHRLQLLWQRRDGHATSELFTFGSALARGSQLDPKWLAHQVAVVKQPDTNNQNGAIFEILAAKYLDAPDQVVIPAPINQKGYDLDVDTPTARWRVSLKTYSESTHSKTFQRRMDLVRKRIIELISSQRDHLQILVVGSAYPTESDWQELLALVRDLFGPGAGAPTMPVARGIWNILLKPLIQDPPEVFASTRSSYTFTGTVPFHANEQKNFVDKLELAVSQLAKHVPLSSARSAVILLRVPQSASAVTLQSWVDEYLRDHPDSVLDGVFILQPYLTSDPTGEKSLAAYFLATSISERYRAAGNSLRITIPVGVTTSSPPTWRFKAGPAASALGSQYIFQKGEHYILPRATATGMEMKISRKAPGVHSYVMVEDRQGAPILGGRWGEELLLTG